MPSEDTPLLRSGPSINIAYVTFTNYSQRNVDVLWIDFKGDRKNYTPGGLPPQHYIDITTFTGHPWIFRDSANNDKLVCSVKEKKFREVYYPEYCDGSSNYRAPICVIHIPVYTLKERCLSVVRNLIKYNKDFDELEIPKLLQQALAYPKDSVNPDEIIPVTVEEDDAA